MPDVVSDPLVNRLVASGKLEFILKGLGLFLRDFSNGQFFPNMVWKDLGYGEIFQQFEGWTALLHPDDRPEVLMQYEDVIRGDRDFFEAEFRLKDRNGDWKWVRHRALVLERAEDRSPTLYAGIDTDVTSYKERLTATQASLRYFEQKYWQTETLRVAGAIVASELEPSKAVDSILAQAQLLLPFDAAAVWMYRGSHLLWAGGHNLEPDDLIPLDESGSDYLKMKQEKKPCLLTDYTQKNPERFLRNREFRGWLGVPLILQNQIVGFLEFMTIRPGALKLDHLWSVSVLADQTAVALANAAKYHTSEIEASTDTLTGLLTRRSFERLADHYWQHKEGHSTAVMMLDLDHFKRVNDQWGHAAGDEVIRRAADICRSVLRESDLICRWGGEELAILLQGSSLSSAQGAAERIRDGIERARLDSYPDLRFTISVGLTASPPGSHDSLKELLGRADEALYTAKEQGRNQVVTFESLSK